MANKKISQLTAVTTLSNNDTFPVIQGTETKKAKISDVKSYLPTASSLTTGLLSNTDWTTFNNKQSALTLGNLTESTSSVLTITGGTGSVIGSGLSIQVKQASGSQSGFLSSSDWTTFNNKLNSLTLTTTGTSGAATLVGSTLNIPQYLGTALTSLGGQTGATQTFSTDSTGSDFAITSAANNHKFSLPTASASARGLLSSTDWSTFNSKEPAITKGNLTESTSSVLTITGGTGSVIGSGTTIQVKQANGSQSGFLSTGDWSTFNAKQGALTLTTTGSSGAATLVNNVLNVPQYSGGGTTTAVNIQAAYNALGSVIKGYNVANPVNAVTTQFSISSGSNYLSAYYIPVASTITGVKWFQVTTGAYTAGNYNGVGLYSYSGGTITLVASSTNDGNIWKSSSGWNSKAFSSTYSAAAGVYFISFLFTGTSITTNPVIGAWFNNLFNSVVPMDFTNNAKLNCNFAGVNAFSSSTALTFVTNQSNNPSIFLY